MSIPDFGAELAEYKNHLLNAYYRGFDDAVESLVHTAQERALKGQPQPQLPLPQPKPLTQLEREFAPRLWTKVEDDFLREAWGTMPFRELSVTYKRSPAAVRLRGKVLGLPHIPKNYQFPGSKP
jgi:hypothetical protein